MTTRRVLVTGATGFLGPYVIAALKDAGWSVRAAFRDGSQRAGDEQAIVGSIGSRTNWTAALTGVDAVVHLAGLAHQTGARAAAIADRYTEINTAGTLRLAQAAQRTEVAQFVFVSSILVNGASSDGRGPFREDDAPAPANIYSRSKADAEAGLRQLAGGRMIITVVRPPLIYGRGTRGNFALLARVLRAGLPLPFGAVANRRAFAAAGNIASFITHRLDQAGARSDTFIVADDAQVSTPDFIRRMAAATGRRVWLLPVSPTLLRSALRLARRGYLADSLIGSLEVDTARAHATGWRPELTLDEGLRAALRPDAGAPQQ